MPATPGAAPRVVIENPRPSVECGRFAAKASLGLPLEVSADVFADGHDLVMAWVRHGRPSGDPDARPGWHEALMTPAGGDRRQATIRPARIGAWAFEILAQPDEYGTWLRDLRLRLDAGQDVETEFEEAGLMADRYAGVAGVRPVDRTALEALGRALRSRDTVSRRLREAGRPAVVSLMQRCADRTTASRSGPWSLFVDRERATFSAWYEMFPRSEGARPPQGGSFRSAAGRLPAIAGMGFDIVYLPPIHPIGVTFRKGRNNSLDPAPDDVGSPWAIGAAEGGHTAIHPDLGSIDDFREFVTEARRLDLEVALDYALQCSPDHPWVKAHPQWFRHRPDGTIRYAENPPKRYQDIFPINFDTADRVNLWNALRDIMLFWIGHGIRVFRVDNPHTKPFPFWEWLIADLRRRHPEVILLAEAFTRPAVMQRLGKIGFTQSYTYFTWRNHKHELAEYLSQLSLTAQVDWYRPNFWVNTPDILHAFLQHGGPAAFRLRAALAAIAAPSWGMYSGYELGERLALREGSEEYLDSEKYQLRPRHWDQPGSLASYIGQLNQIRRRHREAISLLPTLRLHHVGNDNLLCLSRMNQSREDVILLLVNLDPHQPHEGTTWLDLAAVGIPADRPFEAHDELTNTTYVWQGAANYVRLDPAQQSAHVLHLRPR